MAYDKNDFLELLSDATVSLDRILSYIEFIDLEPEHIISPSIFSTIVNIQLKTINPNPTVLNNIDKILAAMYESGLDFNKHGSKDGDFNYGQLVMRYSSIKAIKYVLSHGFIFNSLTNGAKTHSLNLLIHNYARTTENKKEFLKIIKEQLEKGIDYSLILTPSFFFKTWYDLKSTDGWQELIDLLQSDEPTLNFIMDNTDLIIDKEWFDLLPSECRTILFI